jgi:hypothetical protein
MFSSPQADASLVFVRSNKKLPAQPPQGYAPPGGRFQWIAFWSTKWQWRMPRCTDTPQPAEIGTTPSFEVHTAPSARPLPIVPPDSITRNSIAC